jgi:hypothetical protein
MIEMWDTLRRVCHFLRAKSYTIEELDEWEPLIALFVAQWHSVHDDAPLTRYMYLLRSVGGFFMRTYGVLAIWNAQGLEKSHWREKCVFMSKTNKGGGHGGPSALAQLAHVSFRTMLHRADAAARKIEMIRLGHG